MPPRIEFPPPPLLIHWPSNLHVPSSYIINSSTLTWKTSSAWSDSSALGERAQMPPPPARFVFPLWVSELLGRIVGNGTYIPQMPVCLYALASGRPDPSNCTKTVHGRSLAQRKHRALYQEKVIMDVLENSAAVRPVSDRWSCLMIKALIDVSCGKKLYCSFFNVLSL